MIAAKGLEAGSGMTVSEILGGCLSGAPHAGLVALSGPNLAQEVVRRVPTVAVAASDTVGAGAASARKLLSVPRAFRVYTHGDVRGVELAGALKNVLAIGAGISDGLGFGDNTKAALMTRGLMEMSRLGLAAGANALTFLGLAGVGDLMATANSRLSRNYRVGAGLARGQNPPGNSLRPRPGRRRRDHLAGRPAAARALPDRSPAFRDALRGHSSRQVAFGGGGRADDQAGEGRVRLRLPEPIRPFRPPSRSGRQG